MKRLSPAVTVLLMVAGTSAPVAAQPAPAQAPKTIVTALMVEVTISRYQGEKRISSFPYTLAVPPDGSRYTLRMGGEVAVPSIAPAAAGSGNEKAPPAQAQMSYSYRSIGTSLDVTAAPTDEGRFRVGIIVEDTSVYPPGEAAKNMTLVAGAPAFRSFRSSNALMLRDGQSIDYTAATDRITGETARISVKLTVVK